MSEKLIEFNEAMSNAPLSAVSFEDRLEPISADAEVTGGRLRYAMAGDGQAILFCHGIPLSMSTWQDLFFALASRYKVIAVDLPGYGRSSKAFPEHSLSTMSQALADLCAEIGVSRVHAVGSSFGAAVAATLALNAQGLVDRLVLINSVGIAGGTHSVERLARVGLVRQALRSALVRERLGRRIFRSKLRNSYATLTPDEALVDHYFSLLQREDGAQSFLQTLRLFRERNLQRNLPSLKRPVLSIWGARDRVLPASKSIKIQMLLHQCWSTIIDGAGHLPHEEQPMQCAFLIDTFLRQPEA